MSYLHTSAGATSAIPLNEPERRVVVIGAGPSGVSVAVSLRDRGVRALLVDRADHVGSSWSRRYDRLKLNTGKQFSHLPHRRYPAHTGTFPTRDQVVEHLDRHAHEDGIDLRLNTSVQRIDRQTGGWLLTTSTGAIRATRVVIATGYEHTPVTPDWPGCEAFHGERLHSAAYRNPERHRGKRVLVVGAGSSAMEIAYDLATGGAAKVWLAVRTPPNIMLRTLPGGWPSDLVARPLYSAPPRFADAVADLGRRLSIGDLRAFGLATPTEGVFTRGKRLGRAPAIVDREVLDAIRAGTIEVVPTIDRFDVDGVRLVDQRELALDTVICATGYRRGLDTLVGHLGLLDHRGLPRTHGTTAAATGLWFIGFQSRPGLIAHVAKQSGWLAAQIARDTQRSTVPR